MVNVTGTATRVVRGYAAVTVPCHVDSIRMATQFLVQAARNMHIPPAGDALFEVAIAEALNNAVEHGAANGDADPLIVCELELVEHRLTVRILDQGQGFVLARAPRPDWDPDDLSTVPEGGFGIPIIHTVFPTVRTLERPGEFGLEMALTF